ncbi:hypothetical protein CDO52_07065 [Nocardiopsis gilva YIM 90087]|uniref:Uncharacterized protein n=1 Tax=Nocardiopsis gilva YIM 90087 TaxID=1235441 RepID=A0A223S362_9ACTN|nr:hypothetical protein [Nocardiopsis gilva]ASU82576.1 hypothetical protein CDO52_07065 [Nocardiopsis gilva YIM 90087]
MSLTTTTVRAWAEEILRQLHAPKGHTLDVIASRTSGGGTAAPPEAIPEFTSHLRVSWDGEAEEDLDRVHGSAPSGVVVTLAFGAESSIEVALEESMDESESVALLADQLQTAVLEVACGAPAPECPGHGHPLTPQVLDGVACWVCPKDPGRRWAILPESAPETRRDS